MCVVLALTLHQIGVLRCNVLVNCWNTKATRTERAVAFLLVDCKNLLVDYSDHYLISCSTRCHRSLRLVSVQHLAILQIQSTDL